MHVTECEKPSNTGRLLAQSLSQTQVLVIGKLGGDPDYNALRDPRFEPMLLFPEASGITLSSEYVRSLTKPINLIVPDGTWRQAKRMAHRRQEFFGLKRVQLPPQPPSNYRLRRRGRPGGVCTAEAVARALGIIEGPEVEEQILSLLESMVDRVLWTKSSDKPFPVQP